MSAFLPNASGWGNKQQLPVAERDTLNDSATPARETQLSVAAENAPLRVIYGQARLGPQIACVLPYQGDLVILAVWCQGEVHGVVSLDVDDKPAPAGVTATHYTGTTGQTANALLVAAFAAQTPPVTYTDALPGICYSVVRVGSAASAGFPRLNALIKGMKVVGAENKLYWSEDFSQASWTKASGLVVTQISGEEWEIDFTGCAANAGIWEMGALVPSLGAYINSVDMRVISHAGVPTILQSEPAGTDGSIPNVVQTLSSTWARYYASGANAVTARTRGLWLRKITGGALIIRVRRPQINNGSYPLPYAATTAALVSFGAITWSDNPAWCLSDFITNAIYGMGRTVDWVSAASVAADCDALVGSAPNQEKLRTINLVMETIQPVANWRETLRTYAGCWVVQSGTDLKLVSDKAGAPVAAFDHAASNIQVLSPLKKRGVQNTPTVMTVTYTDTTTVPYRDAPAQVLAAGVSAGTTPRRESQVSLPGINRYSQAMREATERLNKLLLNDLSFELGAFDESLKIEVGDIVTVTHPIGLASKQMRTMRVNGEQGRYKLGLEEYDPAVYSINVISTPTWVDTNLPSPTAPPALTGLTLAEEVYQQQDGTYSSRIRVTWNAATYAFLKYYRVEVRNSAGLELIDSVSLDQSTAPTYASPAIQEGINYTIKVQAISTIGAAGTWSTSTIAAVGKQLVPSNVSAVTGFEVGGEVRLAWAAAVDIDIWKYEVRYGAVGVAWASATLIDRFDGLRCVTKDIPTGTWAFLVKAVDSVGQYSATEARISITVTLDVASFLVDNHSFSTPTLSNAKSFVLGRTDGIARYVTDDGAAFGAKYPLAVGTYARLLQTASASEWLSESYDFGLSLSGNWTATSSGIATLGAITQYLELSPDNTTWTQYSTLVAKATARFVRVRVTAAAGNALLITIPTVSVRIDAIPREENSSSAGVMSVASGPTPIGMANAYTSVKSITVSPIGTTSLTWTIDKIVASGQPNYAARWNLEFNGTTNYVSVTSYAGIQLLTGTVEVMVRAAVAPLANTVVVEHQGLSSNPSRNSWGFVLLTTGGIAFQISWSGAVTNSPFSSTICDDKWHRVTGVFASTSIALYVDGALVGTIAIAAGVSAPNGLLGIGARPPFAPGSGTTWTQLCSARIADVRIWNTQRTAAQILANAFVPLAGVEAGLVGYWPLNAQSGTVAANMVAGGTAGTLVNAPLWKPFDGFDAYIFNGAGTQVANLFTWNFKGV